MFVDGMSLALGENGDLVIDELVYNPATKGGKAAISLVSGAAEFVSGTIAHSGQDNMTFKTPVGTIGIRGTKVFVSFDPVNGDVSIINRPTGADPQGNVTAGEIFLSLPDGTPVGSITSGNGGWQWNPQQGQAPQTVQLTEAQVQNVVSTVEATVNNLATQQPPQPQAAPGTPAAGTGPGGAAGGAQGGDAQGGGTGNQGGGGTGDAGQTTTTTTTTTATTASTATQNTTTSTTTTTSTSTATSSQSFAAPPSFGTPAPSISAPPSTSSPPPTPPVVVPPVILPPIQLQPSDFTVTVDNATPIDKTSTSITFTISRSNNLTTPATISFSTQNGSAVEGQDFGGASGTLDFAPGETSKSVTVTILANSRVEGAENFSFSISAGTGAVVTSGSVGITIPADPPLPVIALATTSVTVSDTSASTASITVTRTGDLTQSSTVAYTTVGGTATAGKDFTAVSGTFTFAAGESSKTISIPILADTIPLKFSNQEPAETFTVVLSGATDATLGDSTATVTIAPDPVVGLATFSISSASASEGDTVTLTVSRGGDLIGQVSVDYSVPSGTRNSSSSGTLTFAAGELSKSISVSISKDTPVHPAETIAVTLSNPDGGTIGQGTGSISIAADPVIITTGIRLSGNVSVSDAVANTVTLTVTLSEPASYGITVNYATVPGTAVAGTDYIAASGTLSFGVGEITKTITISIPAQPTKTTSSTFTVVLSNASAPSEILIGTSTVTILGNHINSAPTAIGAALLPTILPGDTNPAGGVVTTTIGSRFVDIDGDAMSGIAIIANQATAAEGRWQYSSDGGLHWVDVESAPANPPNTSPQVIATSSLLRFLPAGGFFGAAPALIVAVMDNTYTGTFSNSATNTPVILSSPTFGGTSYLSSINLPIQQLIMVTNTWDGGSSGDWATAANWTGDVLPTNARVALISGASVTLQNNQSNNIGYLRLVSSASLTVTGGTTILRPLLGAMLDVGTTLSVYDAKIDADAAVTNAGTINIGQVGVSTGTFSGAGAITNTNGGVVNANQGSMTGLTNTGTFSVVDTTAFTMYGGVTNVVGGTFLIKAGTAAAALTVAAPVTFVNTGTLQMTSVGSFNAELDITGTALRNVTTGVIQLDAGGGGERIIAGDLFNLSGGTIKVNTSHAKFTGALFANQGGTLNISSGSALTIAAGSKMTHNGGTFVGSGVAATATTPPGALAIADGAELNLISSLTLPLGFGLIVGTTTGFGGSVTGSGTLTVAGGINLLSGTISVPVSVTSGGSLRVSGDGTVILNNATTIASGAFFNINNNNDDLYVRLAFGASVNNNGTIFLYAINTDTVTTQEATFDFSLGTFNNNSGGTVSVTRVFTSAPASTMYAAGIRTLIGSMNNASGATLSIQTNTQYAGGTLHNYGSLLITNSNSLTTSTAFSFGSGATFEYNSGTLSGYTANGVGASVLFMGLGSTLTLNSTLSIPTGLTLVLGSADGGPTVSGSATGIQIQGGVMVATNVNLSKTVTVNAGGSLNVATNGLVALSTITLNGDGTAPNSGTFTLQGGSSDVYVTITGTITSSGGRIIFSGGGVPHDITLDMSAAGVFTNNANGQFLVNSSTGGGQRIIKLPSTAGFYNFGAIIISADTRFVVSSASDLPLANNGGSYTIQNSAVVDYVGTPLGNGLVNQSGSTFNINSGSSLNLHHANFYNNATLVVNGYIDMGGGNLDNNNLGTISGSGIIFMGGGTFTNNGTSSITPGNSPGHMTIDGNAIFGANTHTEIQLAGVDAGQFDVLDITKHVGMGGSLDVVSYDGFLPKAGDSFHVMNWGDSSGFFDKATGLVMPNGVALDPVFDDHGLTLVARAITHQAGEGDTTLVGTDQADVMVAGAGNDTLVANGGNDLMIGGSGHATFVVGSGNDHIVGGSGANTVDFSVQASAVNVNLSTGKAITALGGGHTIVGVQDVIGSNFNDTIIGNAHDNVIAGGLGHDVLTGGEGNDTFVLKSPVDGGDTITDFTTSHDSICLDATAFGLAGGACKVGENFSIIADHFDGTNAGANTAFAAGQASLIYSAADHTLYFDSNGAPEGYTAVATLQPGATLSAADIKIVDHHALV